MAKYPAPGRVKTRLAVELGAERASALYEAFVLDLAGRLAGMPYAVRWAFWPPDAPFTTLVPSVDARAQRGGDLGERMGGAIATAFAEGPGALVVIGADAPHVAAERLEEAFAALGGGADLVLGPADDGGYYLLGLSAPMPELFTGIPWSTPQVLRATLDQASRLGLAARLLPPTFDVDEAADLARLRALLADGRVDLPRTSALLAECPPEERSTK
jgi:rSAM/selenodomain-associated transferase 1